jgi:DNA (cytosine-5)-methyltransferase 1
MPTPRISVGRRVNSSFHDDLLRCEAKSPLRAIDLFCGAGGSSWGALQAGVSVVAAFDQWDLAGKNHHRNFSETRFYQGLLESADLRKLGKEIGDVDLILASPECTNHSPAKGNKPRCELSKDTAFQVTRFAERFSPRWVVVENVVSMRSWARFEEFINSLRALGYHVLVQVLDSSHFGVAQGRRRLFMLADRLTPPRPTTPTTTTQRHASSIVDLTADYHWSPLRRRGRAAATLARAQRGIRAVGADSPFLLVYYGSDAAGGWQLLSRPLRTITTIDRFAIVKPSATGHQMRMLQVPELMAAMGMEGMRLDYGTRREKIKLIGNAVCPPVMRAVVDQLVKAK